MPSRAADAAARPQNGWWKKYAERLASGYREVIAAEEDASRIIHFHPTFVPGLLQTAAYAAAITPATTLKATSAEDMAVLVEVRMTRQRLAFDEDRHKELVFILDESALYRPVGSPVVMREQLTRLLTLTEHPAVTLVVLPFRSRLHPGLLGAFTLMGYRSGVPELLCFDGQLGNKVVRDSPAMAKQYRALVDDMLASDPDGVRTRRLITTAHARVHSWSDW